MSVVYHIPHVAWSGDVFFVRSSTREPLVHVRRDWLLQLSAWATSSEHCYMFSVRSLRLNEVMDELTQFSRDNSYSTPYVVLRGVLPTIFWGDGSYDVILLTDWGRLPENYADLKPLPQVIAECEVHSVGVEVAHNQLANALLNSQRLNPYAHRAATGYPEHWNDPAFSTYATALQLSHEMHAFMEETDRWGATRTNWSAPNPDDYDTQFELELYRRGISRTNTMEGNVMPTNTTATNIYCGYCGDVGRSDDTAWVSDNRRWPTSYCPNCIDQGVVGQCEAPNCDVFGSRNEFVDDNDDVLMLCQSCYDDECERQSGEIHYYSYRPPLEFYSTDELGRVTIHNSALGHQVYMGMELELEVGDYGKRGRAAKAIYDRTGDVVYCKEDGSLNCGIEVVSHPMTLDVWQHNFDWHWTQQLADMGCRAWNTQTAGLHIHVGLTSFSDRSHFARFYMLFMRNSDEWIKLAGRDSSRWASFHEYDDQGAAVRRAFGVFPAALQLPPLETRGMTPRQVDYARFEREMFIKYHPNKFIRPDFGRTNNGRYVALNCQNQSTIELRFWRPSLKATTVLAALEATAAAVEYTRTLKVLSTKDKVLQNKGEALTWESFYAWMLEPENVERYPHALARIAGRVGGENPTSVPTSSQDRNH